MCSGQMVCNLVHTVFWCNRIYFLKVWLHFIVYFLLELREMGGWSLFVAEINFPCIIQRSFNAQTESLMMKMTHTNPFCLCLVILPASSIDESTNCGGKVQLTIYLIFILTLTTLFWEASAQPLISVIHILLIAIIPLESRCLSQRKKKKYSQISFLVYVFNLRERYS